MALSSVFCYKIARGSDPYVKGSDPLAILLAYLLVFQINEIICCLANSISDIEEISVKKDCILRVTSLKCILYRQNIEIYYESEGALWMVQCLSGHGGRLYRPY